MGVSFALQSQRFAFRERNEETCCAKSKTLLPPSALSKADCNIFLNNQTLPTYCSRNSPTIAKATSKSSEGFQKRYSREPSNRIKFVRGNKIKFKKKRGSFLANQIRHSSPTIYTGLRNEQFDAPKIYRRSKR